MRLGAGGEQSDAAGGGPGGGAGLPAVGPAINPIVLLATYVAFPGDPWMVAARLLASLFTSVAMGWLWIRLGREEWLRLPKVPAGHAPGANRLEE